MVLRPVLAIACLALGACTVSIDATGARFSCSNDRQCPAHFLCGAEGLCEREDGPLADAGSSDGGCVPVTFPELVLADSPLLYYPMNETSGSTIADASGHGHTGQLFTTYTLGVEGARPGAADNRAIRFERDNAYAYTGNVTWPPEVTWEAVIRPLDPEPGRSGAVFVSEEYLVNGWRVSISADGVPHLYCNESGCSEPLQPGPGVTRGAWHHVALTIRGNDFNFYLDGLLAITATFPSYIPHPAGGLFGPGEGMPMVEEIDEAAIYDHLLSPSAIMLHARAALAESVCR